MKIIHPLLQIAFQVLEIIQTHTSIDLFNPELEKEKQKRTADPVTTDLLGALLSVRSLTQSQCGKYKSFPLIGFFVKLIFMSREHEKLSCNDFRISTCLFGKFLTKSKNKNAHSPKLILRKTLLVGKFFKFPHCVHCCKFFVPIC